jgi:hypothetical protein
MVRYSVSPKYKKSIEEREIWQRDGRELVRTQGWRGGSVWLITEDDQPLDIKAENPDGLLITDCGYEYELDSFWDGVYDDWIWPEDMSEEEQELILAAWEEDSYEALENLGWTNVDTEIWFFGPLDIEKTPD